MKHLTNNLRAVLGSLMILLLTIGCQETGNSVAGPDNPSATNSQFTQLARRGKPVSYPQTGQMVVSYLSYYNLYNQNFVNLDQGSKLIVPYGAFTPPQGMWGENVTITISADLNTTTNELQFEFGPHGSQFDAPAELWLNWDDIGKEQPTLFYIDENGNYIEQQPDEVDLKKKKMKIFLHHFSRYALVHG